MIDMERIYACAIAFAGTCRRDTRTASGRTTSRAVPTRDGGPIRILIHRETKPAAERVRRALQRHDARRALERRGVYAATCNEGPGSSAIPRQSWLGCTSR